MSIVKLGIILTRLFLKMGDREIRVILGPAGIYYSFFVYSDFVYYNVPRFVRIEFACGNRRKRYTVCLIFSGRLILLDKVHYLAARASIIYSQSAKERFLDSFIFLSYFFR